MSILKHFLISLFVLGGLLVLPSAAAYAAPTTNAGGSGAGCNSYFLTVPAWFNGLAQADKDGNCEIMSPSQLNSADGTGGFKKFVWTIALNVVEILLNIVGYAAVGFIIYGGIKYIYSAGSPTGMVSARKTIMNAVIGLVLSILSVAVVNTIAGSLK